MKMMGAELLSAKKVKGMAYIMFCNGQFICINTYGPQELT